MNNVLFAITGKWHGYVSDMTEGSSKALSEGLTQSHWRYGLCTTGSLIFSPLLKLLVLVGFNTLCINGVRFIRLS